MSLLTLNQIPGGWIVSILPQKYLTPLAVDIRDSARRAEHAREIVHEVKLADITLRETSEIFGLKIDLRMFDSIREIHQGFIRESSETIPSIMSELKRDSLWFLKARSLTDPAAMRFLKGQIDVMDCDANACAISGISLIQEVIGQRGLISAARASKNSPERRNREQLEFSLLKLRWLAARPSGAPLSHRKALAKPIA